MKIRFNFICMLVSALMLSFASCKKDQTLVVAKPSTPVSLTASQSTIILSEDKAADKAVDLTWNKADFGYAAAISYLLQVSYKDSAFSRVSSLGMGQATSTSFTVADLNTLLLGAKYKANEASEVQIRVLAQVADSLYAYSDPLTITVTPYVAKRVIPYPFLYVPGDYQGWAPDADIIAKLYSINDDGKYEGYLNLTKADNPFKFTVDPNWDGVQYAAGATEGTIAASGDNLDIAGAGYYLIQADTKALTWSATLENWGIVGDAAGGWGDGDDIMFDFDPENQVLTKTVQLNAGLLKLRANHKWDLNIGTGDVYGADNYTITQAGTYVITLDLRVPKEPVVTMTLQ